MIVLNDGDIGALMQVGDAVLVMREALAARSHGQMISPGREGFQTGKAGLVWTPGGFLDNPIMGLRLYPTGVARDDQLAALWDAKTRELLCAAVGSHLGRLRTAAIGGVAIDHLACPEASVVGVIGFGRQGWLQIEAALSVRTIRTVKVYRRDLEALAVSANQAGRAWNVDCVAVADAEEAVRMADIVITATHSPYPVFKASWLKPGAHINALGPKYVGRTELGSDVVARADLLVSDFPEQYRSEPLFILQGTPHMERLQDLAWTLQNSRRKEAGSERVTLFLSHGLAGTEILLLKALYDKALKTGQGTRIGLGTREELPGPPCLGQE